MGREGLALKALLQRRWNFILLSFLTVNNATYLYRIFVINFERLIHYYDTSIATRATISLFFFFFFIPAISMEKKQPKTLVQIFISPNVELFLVRIFLYSDRIQENTDQK